MQTMRIQNGIFLLGLVSMVFSGDFEIAYDRILYFDFDRLDFKLGPLAFGKSQKSHTHTHTCTHNSRETRRLWTGD